MQSSEMREASKASPDIDAANSSDAAAAPSIPIPKKPTRPLTAYHLFFQLEREHILQTIKSGDDGMPNDNKVDERPIGKQIDPGIPFRYRHIRLNPRWYVSASEKRVRNVDGEQQEKKRKHRKTHGKVGFIDLSKRVASRWSMLDEADGATKKYVRDIAARELEIYRQKLNEFKEASMSLETLPEEVENAATMTPKPALKKMESILCARANSSLNVANAGSSPSSTSLGTSLVEASQQLDSTTELKNDEEKMRINRMEGNEKTSSEEYSFHPVPSSFWKKYKKSTKKQGRRRSFCIVDASTSQAASVMSLPPRPSEVWGHHHDPYYSCPMPHSVSDRPTTVELNRYHNSFNLSQSLYQTNDVMQRGNSIRGLSNHCATTGPIYSGQINAHRQSYHRSDHKDFENELNTFPSRTDRMPNERTGKKSDSAIGITLDDALGLMKALSGEDA